MPACELSLPAPSAPSRDAAAMFTANLDVVKVVIASVARRNRLTAEDLEEFTSIVHLKLIERDYAVLRKFTGRSSLRTYLTTVVQRVLLDHRVAQWGKWRPSAAARRGGPAGMLLERLTRREGLTLDQARTRMAGTDGGGIDAAAMARIYEQLPPRASRRCLGEAALSDVVAPGPAADARVDLKSRVRTATRAMGALAGAMHHLSPEDRLILRLRFVENYKISEIVQHLPLPDRQRPKVLYQRLRRLLDGLGEALRHAGIDRSDLLNAVGVFDGLTTPGLFKGAAPAAGSRARRAEQPGRAAKTLASRTMTMECGSQESSHGAALPR